MILTAWFAALIAIMGLVFWLIANAGNILPPLILYSIAILVILGLGGVIVASTDSDREDEVLERAKTFLSKKFRKKKKKGKSFI